MIQIEKVSVCIGCQTLILNKFTIKLSLIRFIGFKETILAIILLAIFLNRDILYVLIGFEIIIINTVIIPNLSLLPSYLSPHFNHQHYSEFESFEEQIFA